MDIKRPVMDGNISFFVGIWACKKKVSGWILFWSGYCCSPGLYWDYSYFEIQVDQVFFYSLEIKLYV